MKTSTPRLDRQSGILLLEGLIAILIFSLGILAVVGMQAMAVKQVTDAQYRSQASMLANQLLGKMWVSSRNTATLQNDFNTGGTEYTSWLNNSVATTLPGVATYPPTVNVSGTNLVTVTVNWAPPGSDKHSYVTIAQIQ